jgi:hypothetical protein
MKAGNYQLWFMFMVVLSKLGLAIFPRCRVSLGAMTGILCDVLMLGDTTRLVDLSIREGHPVVIVSIQ